MKQRYKRRYIWVLSMAVAILVPLDLSLPTIPLVQAAENPSITPKALQQRLQDPQKILLIDVRTPEEYDVGHLPGAILVPIDTIQSGPGLKRIASLLQPGQTLITYCYSGGRSDRALTQLRQTGIPGQTLEGGIVEWRHQIDPTLPEP
jgi:sulfur-carrier protein adenylyltransferase/sulfurtransferase